MYCIKIKQPTDTWIVSICQIEEDATTYLTSLSEEIQLDAILYEIPFEYYPFIIIQNTQMAHDSENYFEYCDFEALQLRIETTRENKIESEEHIYFKYYYVAEPYAQMVTDENFMHYMSHTSVTNLQLDEPYIIDFFHEEIKRNVRNYDIDKLDQLFEHTKTKFNTTLEKQDLALNGYNSLFWEMNYDHACGKLTDEGIKYMIPMVENIECLLGEKKWQHRSFAQHILLEQACQNKPKRANSILQETINAFDNYLISNPEEKLEIHRLLSIAYRWMMKAEPTNATKYWQRAVSEITKAINHEPEKASWSLYFELIYIPVTESISNEQINEQKKAAIHIENFEKEKGGAITYQIALAYQNLEEYLNWKDIKNVFPETVALYWYEKALSYNPTGTTISDQYECADFFNKIGSKTKRIDFLEKTISIYKAILKRDDYRVLELFYIANTYKEISEIYLQNNQQILADSVINHIKSIYEEHLDKVKANSYFHYAQFLEYCYTYKGNITKPTLPELKTIANEVEIQSKGYHTYPYLFLMRIALYENNESQAIMELTKSLILHELCVDATFDSFLEELKDTNHNQVKAFLNETKAFMKEVDKDYYYDPQVKWKELKLMTDEELTLCWINRKEEIRNRIPDSENS